MNFKFLLLLFCSSVVIGQIPLQDSIFQLNEFNDSLTINQIIKKDKQDLFNNLFKLETYKSLKDKEANWIKIKIPKQLETQYLSIENSLFEELNFYLLTDNNIVIPADLKDKKQYRFPIIEINVKKTPSTLFIRSKDALSYRTEFNIRAYNNTTLDKAIGRDYFLMGGFLISMFVLLIASCVFFVYKKELAILWFGIHLAFMFIEYLISSGTFSQWFVPNEIILKWGLDHVSLMLSSCSLMLFYTGFYPFNSKTKYIKKIFQVIASLCLLVSLISIYDGFTGNTLNVEWFAQNLLDVAALTSLICYIILTIKKIIPLYLFIAFLFPVIGIITNTGNLKEFFDSQLVKYLMFQGVYVGILMETIVIIFYIIKQSIDGEMRAISLAKENNKLKVNFDEELANNQEKHQNALLNDVHDSFGGYLEALKLTFINKSIKDESVDNILESFSKEYRLLLNSLYVPNINAENFISSIAAYCNKMDSLSDISINFNTSKNSFNELPQHIAKFVYKAASELTTNALKYSKASIINVSLNVNRSEITLTVLDDGVGFTKNQIKPTSFGINSIKKRAETFKGNFVINSRNKKGSELILTLPIPEIKD